MAGGGYLPVVVQQRVAVRWCTWGASSGQRVPWSTSSQSLPGELSVVGGGSGGGGEGVRCLGLRHG